MNLSIEGWIRILRKLGLRTASDVDVIMEYAKRALEELCAYQAGVATVLRSGESSSVEKELKTTTAAKRRNRVRAISCQKQQQTMSNCYKLRKTSWKKKTPHLVSALLHDTQNVQWKLEMQLMDLKVILGKF